MQKHNDGNVKVICRFRPLNKKELQLGTQSVYDVPNKSCVRIKDSAKPNDPHIFNLDHIFDSNSTQDQIYQVAAKPVVSSVLEGFNGTIFAYGQTSSGKTHTMQGYNIQVASNKGIIPRMVEQVFSTIQKSPENIEFRLKVSIVELYMQKIRDLLDISKQDLKIRSHAKKGIYIQDATEKYVSEVSELYNLMSIGNHNRASCSTNMNEKSSRSHMIFLITIAQTNLTDLSAKSGKLFLVDLAGSEKISKTGAQGQVLNEAKKINLSLTSLGKVIKALTEAKPGSHIPYRQSKLTRILQQSLGGNAKTTLVITCSPHPINLQQTLSTLRFGVSAKKVSNKAKINRELTVGQLQHMLQKAEKEIAQKQRIIKLLQKYITQDLKMKLPSYQEILKLKQPSPKKKIQIEQDLQQQLLQEQNLLNQNQNQNQIQSNPSLLQPISSTLTETQQRISILQKQLESIKQNLQSQTEKLNELRLNYNVLHSENIQIQKQNGLLKNEVKELKIQKLKLKNKIQQEQQISKSFSLNNNNNKEFAKHLLNQVLQLVQSEGQKELLLKKLKIQKWFIEMESEGIDFQKFMELEKQKMVEYVNISMNKSNFNQKPQEKIDITADTERIIEDNNSLNEKLLKMENDLDDLYGKYYDVISMQSTWKAECQLYERKLFNKNKRVKQLVELVQELKKQMENKKDSDTISVFQVTSNRLVKPIRGGSKLFQL